MKAAQIDERRRLVMPPECPANSAVVIQQVDEDTWIVKRQKPLKGFILVPFRHVEKLPDDPEWEKNEEKLARAASKHLPVPDFD